MSFELNFKPKTQDQQTDLGDNIEDQRYDAACCQLLEICDEANISNKAKYLARCLLDQALLLQDKMTNQAFERSVLVCIDQAIDLDQALGNKNDPLIKQEIKSRVLTENINELIFLMEKSAFEDNPEGDRQVWLKKIVEKITAFDLMERLKPEDFPGIIFQNMIEGIQQTINLALSHPLFKHFSTEEIFLGSTEAFLKSKMPSISNHLRIFGYDWPFINREGAKVRQCILKYLAQCQE